MRTPITAAAALLCLAVLAAGAAEPYDAVAPFVDEQTFLVARANLTTLKADELNAPLPAGWKAATSQPVAEVAGFVKSFRSAGGREIFAVVSMADALPLPVLVVPLSEPTVDAEAIARLLAPETAGLSPDDRPAAHKVIGSALVIARPDQLKRLQQSKPADRPELRKALSAAGEATVQVALAPTDDMRRVLSEMLPRLPEIMGGGSSTALTRGVVWASAAVELGAKPSAKVVVQSASAEDAASFVQLYDGVAASLLKEVDAGNFEPFSALGRDVAAALRPSVKGTQAVTAVPSETIVRLLARAEEATTAMMKALEGLNALGQQLAPATSRQADEAAGPASMPAR